MDEAFVGLWDVDEHAGQKLERVELVFAKVLADLGGVVKETSCGACGTKLRFEGLYAGESCLRLSKHTLFVEPLSER